MYAVGDIHGRVDLLAALHDRILDDAAAVTAGRKVLVYLGDYVDRGPCSFAVVDMLIEAPLEGFEIVHLKGNHEDFLLRFVEEENLEEADLWFINGGDATLHSYKVPLLTLPFGLAELETARRAFLAALPPSHMTFFQGLKMFHVEGDYLFVHAGIKPGVPLDEQNEEDLLWIREEFLDSDAAFGHMVVHGHTPAAETDVRPNRIGIDTGAFYTDRLTCLVVEGDSMRFLHT
ncbi:MAG: metallophosphoesterase family protein [Alphaproteobacteria bacterium]|nr:metallophosphoesterase family protein [Alphaproteobacteria bacterium]